MMEVRREADSLCVVKVPADKLWGAQTQRSVEHFSIGRDLFPRETIIASATLKKAAADANHAAGQQDAGAPKRPCRHVAIIERLVPSVMYIAATVNVAERLLTAVTNLRDAIAAKAEECQNIVKIGRTDMRETSIDREGIHV
jgi:fumarate hydratase class II